MPIQTAYNFDHTIAIKGQVAGSGVQEDISAYATLAVEFGLGVVYDSANAGTESRDAGYVGSSPKVKVPTAIGGTFVGVTKRIQKPTYDRPDFLDVVTGTQDSEYLAGDSITVRTKGRIWVHSEQAVAPGDSVFLRAITNGANVRGNFRKDADTLTITNVALTSNVATITAAAHGLTVGQSVTIVGLTTTALNGTYEVASVPTANTFTFAKTNANISSTADSGTIARGDQITKAKWVSKTSGAGLAELELLV
jgi:hypothetical protein